ncbi:hypothetical protein HDU78_010503, partial [Chytriomyces hyalinus]
QFTCANTKCKHRAPFMPPPIPASYPFPVARPPPLYQNPNAHRNHQPNLRSWEVNFVYKEDGKAKNALVKIRLCGECGWMLNYKKELERKEAEIKAARNRERTREREERREDKGKKRRQKAGEDLGDDENDKVALESEDEPVGPLPQKVHKRLAVYLGRIIKAVMKSDLKIEAEEMGEAVLQKCPCASKVSVAAASSNRM